MKKITIIIILIVFATGCRSTKKATKSNIQAKTETVTQTENKVADQVKEEKNLNTETVTTITEVQYNEPDTIKTIAPKTKGFIKSTKTTVIQTKQIDTGKIETQHKQDIKTEVEKKEDTKAKVEVTEKKTAPVQWWAIFGILLIIAAGLAYLQLSGSLTFVKKLFKP